MRLQKLSLVVLACIGVAIGLYTGWLASGLVERTIETRAKRTVSAIGAGWAAVEADGLIISLSGVAPTLDAPLLAKRRLSQISEWIEVVDESSPAIATPTAAMRPQIEIMRGLNQIIVSGRLPKGDGQFSLIEQLKTNADKLSITDLTGPASTVAPPEGWDQAQRVAAMVSGKMLHGRVTVGEKRFVAVGLAQDVTALTEIGTEIGQLNDLGWTALNEVTAPQAIREVFSLTVSVGGAAPGLHECTAENAAQAQRLSQQAKEIFGTEPTPCRIVDAAPHTEWAEIAFDALGIVADLPRADLIITDQKIDLIGAPPTRKRAIQAALADLKDAAPEGFEIALQGGVGSAWQSALAPTNGETHQFRLVADLRPGGHVTLSGITPSSGAIAKTQAITVFPSANISGNTETVSGASKAGWHSAIGAGLAGLSQLSTGRLEVTEGTVQLQGQVADQGNIRAIHNILVSSLPQGWRGASRLMVDPQIQALQQPKPIERCASEMAEIVSKAPIIFAPASSEIDPVSRPVVIDLARALRGCIGGRVEIAGHTDSQGREAANLGLSRTRADALLDALLAEGASIRSLVARGYGESQPIATNSTEAGRAQNRRIEFSVWSEEQ
ncbi:MAG: OmpA family protein [Pikeienuella sp.]